MAQADIGLIGIQFSDLAIGNDWLVGGDLSLTWLRPGHAHITASVGPTFTLGGLHTLPTGEVLTPDGTVIAGLYAAGRTTSGDRPYILR